MAGYSYGCSRVILARQDIWVTDQVWGQNGWILAKFFFAYVYGLRLSRSP